MAIKSYLIKAINIFLKPIDYKISKKSYLDILEENADLIRGFGLLKYLKVNERIKFIKNLNSSKAHLNQDLFVLSELNFKENGFFVEFGATNGITNSNTYMLEKEFKWEGIVAEPGRNWQSELEKKRDCKIEKSCIWKETGKKLLFNEKINGELSTIDYFSNKKIFNNRHKSSDKYLVETLSLEDLLIKHNAPKFIDYLSIDTEGSEFTILKNFTFNKYKFKIITVEHNYTKDREKIYKLLTREGYKRQYEDISGYDDWYVLREN